MYCFYFRLNKVAPKTKASKNNTMKMKNKIFAIEAAPAAIPPNPKIAATIAMMKNMTAQRNIILNFSWLIINIRQEDFYAASSSSAACLISSVIV